jgi:hypothetical protein
MRAARTVSSEPVELIEDAAQRGHLLGRVGDAGLPTVVRADALVGGQQGAGAPPASRARARVPSGSRRSGMPLRGTRLGSS